jgi:hypothetical protein
MREIIGRLKIRMRVYKFLDVQFGVKSLTEKKLKISTVEDLNDPFELLPFGIEDKSKRMALYRARKVWSRTRGVLCFSADWRDPVIWAHYSDKHRGLCLGFDIPDKAGQKVRYISERLQLPEKLALDDANAWIFTKFANWSYEKEIRCCATLEEMSEGKYFMNFSGTLNLVEVIVGARCSLTENQILDAVRPLKYVKLTKARPGFQRFEIVEDLRGF